MIKLLKNADLYTPEHVGICDILLAGSRIMTIGPQARTYEGLPGVEAFDLENAVTVPGLVDLHVHITGGGGEQGPSSRVPEITLTQLTLNGVTTALGLLGTDGVTRSQENLLAKCRALNDEGLTCRMLAGAYQVPSPTLTGSVTRDILAVDPVVGVKVALSDHRSSAPSVQELVRLSCDTRLGGILSGKPGIVVAHIGEGSGMLEPIFQALAQSDLPARTIIPTHCERSDVLTEQAAALTRRGGFADFTADVDGSRGGTARVLAHAKRCGAVMEQVTMSSDSCGSLPIYDESGACVGMDVSTPSTLLDEVRRLVCDQGFALEQALTFVTSNPANVLGMSGQKGCVHPGADADLLVLDKEFRVQHLFAGGRLMVRSGTAVVKGRFQ